MFTNRWVCAMAVFGACGLPSDAAALILYYPNPETISTTVAATVYVGKNGGNQNTSPSVSIVAGADIWESVFVFNGSQVTMSGGRIRESLIALNTSTVSITGGEVGGSLWTGDEGPNPQRGGTILMSGGTASLAGIDRGGTLSLRGGTVQGQIVVSRGSSFYLDGAGRVHGGIGIGLDSQAYISGGDASNGISANYNARVSINGGTIGHTVSATGTSTVSISAGTTTFVHAAGAATINFGGGSARTLSARNNAVIQMTGGSTTSFYTEDRSIGNLHDGNIYGDLTAYGTSTINIYGGAVHGKINAFGTVNIYGGFQARNSLASWDNSLNVSLDGGSSLFALDDGLIQIFGNGLGLTLLDPNFFYDEGDLRGYFHKYVLSGALQDGEDVAGVLLFVQNGTGANYTLNSPVPEPQRLILIIVGIFVVFQTTTRKIPRSMGWNKLQSP